jgi:outer membrane lipoprotein LolB
LTLTSRRDMSGATRRRWLVQASMSGLLIALAGCAGLQARPDLAHLARHSSGRIAIRVEGDASKSMSAGFDLRGDARVGLLELSSPLGTQIARATWQPGNVELVTTDGRRRYAALDELAEDAFGQPVPLLALLDWLKGRAWQGAPTTPLSGEAGHVQMGWEVRLGRFADGVIVARRMTPEPVITLNVRLEAD